MLPICRDVESSPLWAFRDSRDEQILLICGCLRACNEVMRSTSTEYYESQLIRQLRVAVQKCGNFWDADSSSRTSRLL